MTEQASLKKNHSVRKRECGLCGSTENLVGPHAGGPFVWICKNCKELIAKWEKAKKEHHDFMMRLIADAKKQREASLHP